MTRSLTDRPLGVSVLLLAALGPAACSSDDSSSNGPSPPIVNLVVDANRNGLLEVDPDTDDVGEEGFSAEAGAVFLVNLDDDDGDKKSDAEDEVVNGPADELDLARFAVQAWPGAPDSATGVLNLDEVAKSAVRVFRTDTWAKVDFPLTLTAAELRTNVIFAIEALDFVRKTDQPWQGLATFTLTVSDDKGEVGTDVAALRAAPWMINHNLRRYDTVYYSNFSHKLTSTYPAPLEEAGITPQVLADSYTTGWADIWFEDWFQTGWTAMPAIDGSGGVHGMIVYNPRPWGRDPGKEPVKFLRANWLGPDKAVAVFWNEQSELNKGSTYDSHGNHEAIPPYPAAPAGRIFTGSGVLQSTKDFYAAQQVQPPISLKTSWLVVGHIDEVYSSVRAGTPNGFKMLENNPAMGRKLFQDWEAEGNGSAIVFSGLKDFDNKSWQTTVAEINADSVLMAWNQEAQTEIDGMHDQLLAETGLTEEEVIQVPVLYEEIDGGKIAYLPDTANLRVVDEGNMAIFAKTQGPMIAGEDAFRKYLESYLADPKLLLGKDGAGLKIRYGDSWEYHVLMGDIHCASNWSALPQNDEPAWWLAAK